METKAQIERYIRNSKLPDITAYDLTVPEARELVKMADISKSEMLNALILVFYYGQAKVYRMAHRSTRQ